MAPIKFEKHIEKQLKEREIQPSANAWERLSDTLETTAPQQKKKGYFWYGIAASFIGVLILSVVYFNSESPVNTPKIELVDTNQEILETIESPNKEVESHLQEEVVENTQVKELPTKVQEPTKNQKPELNNQIASTAKSSSEIEKASMLKGSKEEMLQIKILEIVAAVDALERNNVSLTNAEVDSLLRNAQDEILRDKLFDINGSVDAMALLDEAENELDKSFRDQIFDSLKTGFLKVRTAVADRNN